MSVDQKALMETAEELYDTTRDPHQIQNLAGGRRKVFQRLAPRKREAYPYRGGTAARVGLLTGNKSAPGAGGRAGTDAAPLLR